MVTGPSGCGKSMMYQMFEYMFDAKKLYHIGLGNNLPFQNPSMVEGSVLLKEELVQNELMMLGGSSVFKQYADTTSAKPIDIKYGNPIMCNQGSPLVMNTNEPLSSILKYMHTFSPNETTFDTSVNPIL